MVDCFARHDLVRVEPRAWTAWLRTRSDLAGLRRVGDWAEAGHPLIVRRRLPGEAGDAVPLGLPLPPTDGKLRIALALPSAVLTPATAPSLAAVSDYAPAAWRPTLAALVALARARGIALRPFGSLLWQAATNLLYLGAESDLDLLWPCPEPVPEGLLADLAAVAQTAPMRIDGEIVLPDGAGLQWRELHDAPAGGSVLAKSRDGIALRPVDPIRGPASA